MWRRWTRYCVPLAHFVDTLPKAKLRTRKYCTESCRLRGECERRREPGYLLRRTSSAYVHEPSPTSRLDLLPRRAFFSDELSEARCARIDNAISTRPMPTSRLTSPLMGVRLAFLSQIVAIHIVMSCLD